MLIWLCSNWKNGQKRQVCLNSLLFCENFDFFFKKSNVIILFMKSGQWLVLDLIEHSIIVEFCGLNRLY